MDSGRTGEISVTFRRRLVEISFSPDSIKEKRGASKWRKVRRHLHTAVTVRRWVSYPTTAPSGEIFHPQHLVVVGCLHIVTN